MASRLLATSTYELRAALRNGEQLLLVLGIPVLLLVFFAQVDVLPTGTDDPIDFLAPGILALAVMSTAMVQLAIATGFDREYGFLKRLRTTPLRRSELLGAKIAVVVALELLQLLVLVPVAVAVGWHPEWSGLPAAAAGVGLATVAFAGIGFLLAGTLRGLVCLAAANAAYVLLLLVGGMIIELDELPGPLADIARLLPPAALSDLLQGAFRSDLAIPGRAWLVLAAWALITPLMAAAAFSWDPGRD